MPKIYYNTTTKTLQILKGSVEVTTEAIEKIRAAEHTSAQTEKIAAEQAESIAKEAAERAEKIVSDAKAEGERRLAEAVENAKRKASECSAKEKESMQSALDALAEKASAKYAEAAELIENKLISA